MHVYLFLINISLNEYDKVSSPHLGFIMQSVVYFHYSKQMKRKWMDGQHEWMNLVK